MSPIQPLIEGIVVALEREYGNRPFKPSGDAVGELVATICSQHTSDTNTARAYAALRSAYPTWEDVIAAPVANFAEVIRLGGLANLKAPRIQQALRAILERRGELDLGFLRDLPVAQARAWLTTIPGVGPKTASCVLLFSLGMPAMPVDTHVHRVARRLGIIPPRMSAEAAHATLEGQLGADHQAVFSLHMLLIAHGRQTCTARRPYCERCCLTDRCAYYAREVLSE